MRKGNRGGARKGAGRKPAQPGEVRRNRVVVMLIDSDFDALKRIAAERDLALGTVAHEVLTKWLRRRP